MEENKIVMMELWKFENSDFTGAVQELQGAAQELKGAATGAERSCELPSFFVLQA